MFCSFPAQERKAMRKNGIIRSSICIYVLTLIAAFCFIKIDFAIADVDRSLTLLVYMCGSDLESNHAAASKDLQEIKEACAGNERVSVLVMTGGSKQWSGGIDAAETAIYEIGSKGMRRIQSFPRMNMGDENTLAEFLHLGPELRPAQNYALILWDHGGGPLEGVCYDEQNNMDSLSLNEINKAIRNSRFSSELHFSWIGFDACLMATFETAKCCSAYADYMIASQETEPEYGWNYSFLSLVGDDYDPVQTGKQIVDSFVSGNNERKLTLSMIDLHQVETLENAIQTFFDTATKEIKDNNSYSDYTRSRRQSKDFGRASTGSDYDLADLYDLAGHMNSLLPDESALLQSCIREAVVYTNGNQNGAYGISIYSPAYNKSLFLSRWFRQYLEVPGPTSYQEFLKEYGEFWSRERIADWSHLMGWADPLSGNGSQMINLALLDEQKEAYSDSSVVILEDSGVSDAYHEVYCIHSPVLDDYTLTAEYDFESLYVVSDDGAVLSDSVPFRYVDGFYLIHGFFEKSSVLSEEGSWESIIKHVSSGIHVQFQCLLDRETNELKVVDISPYDEVNLNLGRRSFSNDDLKEYPFIYLIHHDRMVMTDEDGSVLPFSKWEDTNTLSFSMDAIAPDGSLVPYEQWIYDMKEFDDLGYHSKAEIDNRRGWRFKFLPRVPDGHDLYAQYNLYDSQGNQYGSNLIPLTPPEEIQVSELTDIQSQSFNGVSVQPWKLKVIRKDKEIQIYIRMKLLNENRNADYAYLIAERPIINGAAYMKSAVPCLGVSKNGVPVIADLCISSLSVPEMNADEISYISFIPSILTSKITVEIGQDSDFSQLNRIWIPIQINLEGVDLYRWNPDNYISETVLDDVLFRLISIEETDGYAIKGKIGVFTLSNDERRVSFSSLESRKQWPRTSTCLMSDRLFQCVVSPDSLDLVGGGGGCVTFTIQATEDGSLPMSTVVERDDIKDEIKKEWIRINSTEKRIKQVTEIALFPKIDNQINVDLIERSSFGGDILKLHFKKPLFLKHKYYAR